MTSSRLATGRAVLARRTVLALLSIWIWAAPLGALEELPLACAESRAAAAPGAAAGQLQSGTLAPSAQAAVVLLLDLGHELSCALVTALGPWGLRVVESPAYNPGPSMPSSSLAARRIARERSARAVVWLARDAEGFALWVYDARDDRSLARPAPPPPFDPSVAAALALSVKTVLRIVGLAPEASAPEPVTVDRAQPLPASPRGASTATPEAVPSAGQRTATWQVGVYAGARLGPLGTRPDPRYGAELRWSPWAQHAGKTQPWVGLAFESGSPHRLRGPRFEGRVWDPAPELALGLTHELTPRFALGLCGAAALHVTVLSGVARELDLAVDDTRINPALRVSGELRVQLGRPVIALQPALELWLRGQRYLIEDLPLLETRRVSARFGVALQLPLD